MRTTGGMSLLLAPVLACALGGNPREDIREVTEAYLTNLRWERYAEASEVVHPDRRSAFRKLARRTEGRLRITDYEVEAIDTEIPFTTAQASLRYRLVRLPSVVEEEREEQLQLQRHLGRWYVQPDLQALARAAGLDRED